MVKSRTEQFKESAETALLNGWTEEEKSWLRLIGMTEDKPTDPEELKAYWHREYRAYQQWRKKPFAEQYKVSTPSLATPEAM